jgi:hypothetical protein
MYDSTYFCGGNDVMIGRSGGGGGVGVEWRTDIRVIPLFFLTFDIAASLKLRLSIFFCVAAIVNQVIENPLNEILRTLRQNVALTSRVVLLLVVWRGY